MGHGPAARWTLAGVVGVALVALVALTIMCKLFGCTYALYPSHNCMAAPSPARGDPRFHLITYAAGARYQGSAQRLVDTAIQVGGFDDARTVGTEALDARFQAKNAHILTQPRGGGYWLWKPYIIFHALAAMRDGDVLVYCDSQFYFSANVRSYVDRFMRPENHGVLVTSYKPQEKVPASAKELIMSSHEAFYRMGIDYDHPDLKQRQQVWAGFVVLRKSATTLQFVGEWLTYAQDEYIITDKRGAHANAAGFRENRHDQTVLSLLLFKWGIAAAPPPEELIYNVRAGMIRMIPGQTMLM